jgi:hypothetical protein
VGRWTVKVRGEGELTQAERDRVGPNFRRGWTGYKGWTVLIEHAL